MTAHSIPLIEEVLEFESTLTDRYQTTVPEPVRRVLKLQKRDKIRYAIRPDGDVVLTKHNQPPEDDPALGAFLGFLARDMANHPERLRPVEAGLLSRLHDLVGHVEVNLDEPLSADDE